jgi:2-polyprenyl-3-methyl-5-hydroxy-6-metoxy-1,4-benzoquinol methylase
MGFSDSDARDAWSAGARAYEVFVESGADYYRQWVHGPALLAACGPVRGLSVLDVGCGQGYFTRELARAGAQSIGVDLSEALIAYAREHETREPLGVMYEIMSATTVDLRWRGSIDLVTACMAIQDMADVAAALRSAFAVLRDHGRMVCSVPHPCTDVMFREWERDSDGRKLALKIDRYFDSGAATCQWNMARLLYPWATPCWRYTLAQWSTQIAAAGYMIRRLHEPRPSVEQVRDHPELEDCARVPYFLIFDIAKP